MQLPDFSLSSRSSRPNQIKSLVIIFGLIGKVYFRQSIMFWFLSWFKVCKSWLSYLNHKKSNYISNYFLCQWLSKITQEKIKSEFFPDLRVSWKLHMIIAQIIIQLAFTCSKLLIEALAKVVKLLTLNIFQTFF